MRGFQTRGRPSMTASSLKHIFFLVFVGWAHPAFAGGIGVTLAERPWGVVVFNVVPGSAAEGAAIHHEDVIVAVNGIPVSTIGAAVPLIRGDDGTVVHLDLRRGEATLSIDVIRATLSPPTITPPLAFAMGNEGLLKVASNPLGDGSAWIRPGYNVLTIDGVNPTSMADALRLLAGPMGSTAGITATHRIPVIAGVTVNVGHTYWVDRVSMPPAQSPAEREYRAAYVTDMAVGVAQRDDVDRFADVGREARKKLADGTKAARIALGTSTPRPVVPADQFCGNLFALVLDYEGGFQRTRGDAVQPYEKEEVFAGEFKWYYPRSDVPGFDSQWIGVHLTGRTSYEATVREAVPEAEARAVLEQVRAQIAECNGSIMEPNYPIRLFGGTNRGLSALWLAMGGTGAYSPDRFQLVLEAFSVGSSNEDAFDVRLRMASP